MKILLLAALAIVGCSKKSDSGQAAGPSCADAVGKAVDTMPGGPGGGEVQAKLKKIMITRCTEDKWPPAVITCYATQVSDMASMKKCRETLPAEHQQKLMAEIRAVMMGGSAGGAPMHGAPMGGGAPAPSPHAGSSDSAGSGATTK